MNRYTCCLWTIGWMAMLLTGCQSNNESDATNLSDVQPVSNQTPVVAKLPSGSSKSIVTYAPTNAEFPNPERGFINDIELMSGGNFNETRKKGYTLSRAYIRLDEYRNRPLPPEFLAKLNQQFQLVRAAGIKIIPRFAYNFPPGGEIEKAPDAPLDLTISHIKQLKPILLQNADVIAVLQGGFIGAWGEWHASANGLDKPQPKAKILTALLTAVPKSRMVQIRYANDIKTAYPQPLASAGAFRGTSQARVGFLNDCFLSNKSDGGTYEPDLPGLRQYMSKVAPFIAVGGETCSQSPAEHRSDCPTAQAELAKFHWSYLTANFYEGDLDRWREEGCYARISQNLGYRLQLIQSDFPSQVRSDRRLSGNFKIENKGYASPFNPRKLELIVRNQQTAQVYRLPILKSLSKTQDPRFWLPQTGEITVNVRAKIPQSAPPGVYDLLLNLPDPMPKLANRPEYSIQLANEQTWEANTGFNSLQRTVTLVK